jgi:hypothetical protein
VEESLRVRAASCQETGQWWWEVFLGGAPLDWRCFSGRRRVSKTTFMAVGEEAESTRRRALRSLRVEGETCAVGDTLGPGKGPVWRLQGRGSGACW